MYNEISIDRVKKIVSDSFENLGIEGISVFLHSERVAEYSKALTAECVKKYKELVDKIDPERVYLSGILHDIGKKVFPIELLNGKSKLNDEDIEKIKTHPLEGYNLLKKAEEKYNIKLWQDICDAVLFHHENYDGTGYPEGKKNGEIPLIARILRVADFYDASFTRIKTNGGIKQNEENCPCVKTKEYCIEQLKERKGTFFDPNIADIFIEIIKKPVEIISEKINENNLIYKTNSF